MPTYHGCQEGKATPKLVEFLCPQCKELLEGFTRMGAVGTGTLVEDVVCDVCKTIIPEGTHVTEE